MKKVLINFAHPNIAHSKINKALRAAVEELEGVTVNDLYANYPDFLIDVKREQELCDNSDVIIFQYPLYWYSAPSIIKEWIDTVLQHDWAYGSKGNSLKGKILLLALSGSGDESTYKKGGGNFFTIAELTSTYQAMANLCGMKWLPPFTVLGIHRGLSKDKIEYHKENYRRLIIALRDETLNIDSVNQEKYCNINLDKDIWRV